MKKLVIGGVIGLAVLALGLWYFLSRPPKVVIGAKLFTESVILGEMLQALVRDAGVKADLKHLAGTGLVWQALNSGEIDAYVEYTGTLSTEILAEYGLKSTDLDGLRAELATRGLKMSRPLGFNNSYALGMRADRANELGIRSISDLRKPAAHDLKIGLSDEFRTRPDGWVGLKARYGLPQKPGKSLDHAIALQSLVVEAIDVTDLYTTDAEIQQLHLKVLDDDLGYFPRYEAVILWRDDLETRHPDLVEQFRRLEGAIDTKTMTRLNAAVVVAREREAKVAGEYLERSFGLDLPAHSGHGFWSRLLVNGYTHLYLVAISLVAAIVVSIPLGILAYKLPSLGTVVQGLVGILQTIPSLALLVFLLPLFGVGALTAIAAMYLYSLLPIVSNTYTGLKSVPGNLKEAAEVLGLPWYSRLWRIELPLAMPSILGGIRIAAVVSVGLATIGAFVGAGGYGEPIVAGLRLNDLGMILQGAIPAALLALVMQGLFSLLERVLVPRGLRLHPGH